ncbi:3-methyl-2-oxobutanoate dehydrogenase (2-methylpropanoyl-transferring) subunit alpha [Alteriqipengyuania sp. WL0013]|uniref:3-methyl-2-oxobutanoate dehydrogenase (2-methylpropanoyl-transferring) subunit alpha n=1 Tax=Alteriqipengyuania sp. WL0013 TaxID=3110773 RepID=UPI002C9274BC|nr:3-methyl-2-oxobutanoate dehydrogenase (2-methylpropanoyl-transferring) subunit alpha [Alteriqipengyuania sp. WL0013]MEB3415127.1 3-methyl-2-oxobutanoate dehydrogenase (2-methylpropanoyl-transferring) subunit alpha [Alteriqipengyuania sp. WL0013]
MGDQPENGQKIGDNRPSLKLHVPEPKFRPGDTVDYSHLAVTKPGEQPRPDEACAPVETNPLTVDLVRVLGDDDKAHGPWDPRLSPDQLRAILSDMALVRAFDERMYRGQRQGKTSFYMKCTGEEATSVAAAHALASDDMVFPSYRQQGILIARGYPLTEMINQIYSNRADKLKGRQLPIMYSSREHSFFSISGNLATQLPQATGFAMASAIKGDSRIAATWVGEGSTAEGDFHSALTFAAVYNAPVIFNVINNQWAISSFSGFAGAERTTFAARAVGYGIAGLRVDGNDVLAVYAAQRWAAERARTNNGPTLIEYFTYRAEGHSTSDDPSAYRSAAEREEWPLGDPVNRLKKHLIALGEWDEARHEALDAECVDRVKKATKEAEKNGILGHGLHHPFRTMFEDVYEELPWHLKEQAEQAVHEREVKFPGGLPK